MEMQNLIMVTSRHKAAPISKQHFANEAGMGFNPKGKVGGFIFLNVERVLYFLRNK